MFGQSPQGVTYQAVATDLNGLELINQTISIQASVLSSLTTGNTEWQEEHSVTTDAFGLFTLTIGQGTSTGNGAQANFADISWGSATHFLKIEMDVNGGTNYSHMGTNQMMSVPYALYAENANINYDSIATILYNDSLFTTQLNNNLGGNNSLFLRPNMISFQYPQLYNGTFNGSTTSNGLTFHEALLYCDSLTEGGYDDWVIPTFDDIMWASGGGLSIPDSRTPDPLWTSSKAYTSSTQMYYVSIGNGGAINERPISYKLSVRCIRK